MTHFIAVVHQNGDSKYNLYLPDVEGFFAADDNMQTLIAKAASDLPRNLEGKTLPASRTLLEISSDEDIQKDLAQGATLTVIPYKHDVR